MKEIKKIQGAGVSGSTIAPIHGAELHQTPEALVQHLAEMGQLDTLVFSVSRDPRQKKQVVNCTKALMKARAKQLLPAVRKRADSEPRS